MLANIIPEIAFDFNFDIVLIMILMSYILYGYFSGGHKQIRLSINLILPFIIIYYLGKNITTYLYNPLSTTFLYEMINEYMGIVKNTFGMVLAYLITYILLFVGIFILSIYAKKYVLNENMRAKLGKKNNYLGALFAFINGYVLVYFIILPAFSLNLVDTNAHVTNFVLEHPPPFSRIARTAEKAVPVKDLADKASDFEQLLSVEGIEAYYNDAIVSYEESYLGNNDSKEAAFMAIVYPMLSPKSKELLDTTYLSLYSTELSRTNYYGVSIALLEPYGNEKVFNQLVVYEEAFEAEFEEALEIVDAYEASKDQYLIDLANYEYQVAYETYLDELDTYMDALKAHLESKTNALKLGEDYTEEFTLERPTLDVNEPENYVAIENTQNPPTNPEDTVNQSTLDAIDFLDDNQDKENIISELTRYSNDFLDHEGILRWFAIELGNDQSYDPNSNDISPVIISFKNNYDDIIEKTYDEELRDKLYLAQMSIRSYDVFTLWLGCTQDNIQNVQLDDLGNPVYRCDNLDPTLVNSYDFANNALDVVSTLFKGEQISWIIMQYKYDYEAGIFDEPFSEFEEVNEVLASTKTLVDEYDSYYKDIASSIEGNISSIIKIGISVMKYNLDVYETMKNTPLLASFFNDAARMCSSREASPINFRVKVCGGSEGENGIIQEVFNMQYLLSEITFKAYVMVDDENERIVYDSETTQDYLDTINQAIEDDVFTKEVVSIMADQFAFNVIDENSNLTLLEQMYDEGYITIEGMRILASDEYNLFSDEFRARVKSLIR